MDADQDLLKYLVRKAYEDGQRNPVVPINFQVLQEDGGTILRQHNVLRVETSPDQKSVKIFIEKSKEEK